MEAMKNLWEEMAHSMLYLTHSKSKAIYTLAFPENVLAKINQN